MNDRKNRRGGFTCSADSKFEYIYLNDNGSTLNANGYNLTVGRGVSNSNGTGVCANRVVGKSVSAGSTTGGNLNYTIRLESGVFSNFASLIYFSESNSATFSGIVSARAVFGCDYDRAAGNNNNLSVAPDGTVYGGNAIVSFSNSGNRNNITYDWLIKSGKVQSDISIGDADADYAIYLGNSGSANDNDGVGYMGKRRFVMEGGEVASIAGGINAYGSRYTNYLVNDSAAAVQVRIKGGTVRGAIYGAAAFAGAAGDRQFVITGGAINGWIAGGCNGTKTDGGVLYGTTYVYVGGTAQVKPTTANPTIGAGGAKGGNIFGAGSGNAAGYTGTPYVDMSGGMVTDNVFGGDLGANAVVTGNTDVTIRGTAKVQNNVYGGGNAAKVTGNTYVKIK